MASLFDRVLRLLGLKKKHRSSRRSAPQNSRYTYERDENGRLTRHGPNGTERLGYDAWHPVDSKAGASPTRKPKA